MNKHNAVRVTILVLMFVSIAITALGQSTSGGTRSGWEPDGAPAPAIPADLVLVNGHIYTPSGWVDSVAISRGVIVGLGNSSAIKSYLSPKTRTIDLKGQTVLPGLHDMHVHPMGSGLFEMQCKIPQGSSPGQIFAIVEGCVHRHSPGEWITGRAFETVSFGATPPNKTMLDKVAPNNPVLLSDISGHTVWANSMALRLAGITRETPNPQNGIIDRDTNGEPTGLLREKPAVTMVSKLVPPPSRAQNAEALKWALGTMLAQGITAFDDALVTQDIAQAYADLADQGELQQRVRGCLIFSDEGLISRRNFYARERFSPSCVKVVLDGVPTDSRTAAMLEDYQSLPGDTGPMKGWLAIPPPQLNAMVTRFDSMGLTVKFHSAGDASVHEGIEAIAEARKANGFSGLLHDTGHNSFVDMHDIQRAREIGSAMEFSPYIWFDSPIVEDTKRVVPPEVMKRYFAVKDAMDTGVLSVPGSDWATVPTVNPWVGIETLVTRRPPGGAGEPLNPDQRITLKQVIDMYTINSARQRYEADRLGSIETGKLADVIVIDRNIFDVPITTVHDTKVLLTIINGEVVYDAANPSKNALNAAVGN
jgi:predicted amidohydrolase YtcJ